MAYGDTAPETDDQQRILSVSELTHQVKDLMETAFPAVWVSGEISNFSRPQSGHCYFTLKDDQAQIRSVVWRGTAGRLRFDLQDGLEVVCLGHLDVYAPRGSYQLVIEKIEPQGVGALELAFRKLREKLSVEGLFAPERKRPLPMFPLRVAFVTSPTGAAIHDFLEVLRRRWHDVEVMVIPVRVQGEGSAAEIAKGIATAQRLRPAIDVLVVGRGGGSLEDLWAFNEEVVVRAIADCQIPVISAVGHEIDVTLSDLAADVRALTPSEAAERLLPAADEVMARLRGFEQRLAASAHRPWKVAKSRLEALATRRVFRRPYDRLHDLQRRLDEWSGRQQRAVSQLVTAQRSQIQALAGKLDTLSPLAVLGRGFSLTQRLEDGGVLRDATEVTEGDQVKTRLLRGVIISRVEGREIAE